MQWRLRRNDPDEVVRLLAAIANAPAGVQVNALRKLGQKDTSLRPPIAALILHGWIHSPDGCTLYMRSESVRSALTRHPLADVFQPGS